MVARSYQWSNVLTKINDLGNVIQQTNGIAYSAKNISDVFQNAFPGYQAPENFSQQYSDNIKKTLNTLKGVLQSLNMNADDFGDEQKRIAALQGMVENAPGQTQAIQASAQISTEMLSQIQLLRQTVMAQSNAQTAYYAQQLQNQASDAASFQKMMDAGSKKAPPIGTTGEDIDVKD